MKLELTIPNESIEELKTIIREVIKEELQSFQINNIKTDNQQLLSRKEACEFLHCSLTTLYNHQRNGVIPFYQIGRRILFSKQQLIDKLIKNPSK